MASKRRCIVYLVTVGLAVRYVFQSDPLSDYLEDWLFGKPVVALLFDKPLVEPANGATSI